MRTNIFALPLIILTLVAVAWGMNIVKLSGCDFEPDWKCEVIHGIGLFPPAAVVTVWFATDKDYQ